MHGVALHRIHIVCVVWIGAGGLGKAVTDDWRHLDSNAAAKNAKNVVRRTKGQAIVDWKGTVSKRRQTQTVADSLAKPVVRTLAEGLENTTINGSAIELWPELDFTAKSVGSSLQAGDTTLSPHRSHSMLTQAVLVALCGTFVGLISAGVVRWQVVNSQSRVPQPMRRTESGRTATATIAAPRRFTRAMSRVNTQDDANTTPPTSPTQDPCVGDAIAASNSVQGVASLKKAAVFNRKMWKLDQNSEPKDDINEWRERIVWISKGGHIYYHSEHNQRDQQFFEAVAQDLTVTELPPGTSFFEHTVRLQFAAEEREVLLATDSKQIMEKFLESCQGSSTFGSSTFWPF